MNCAHFVSVFDGIRSGTGRFFAHPRNRLFQYSQGVREVADAGCHWLLDVFATELPKQFRSYRANATDVLVNVANGKAEIRADFGYGEHGWHKRIDYTDMPDGEWPFYVANEGGSLKCVLFSEC